jgi:hypothetical protein
VGGPIDKELLFLEGCRCKKSQCISMVQIVVQGDPGAVNYLVTCLECFTYIEIPDSFDSSQDFHHVKVSRARHG